MHWTKDGKICRFFLVHGMTTDTCCMCVCVTGLERTSHSYLDMDESSHTSRPTSKLNISREKNICILLYK